MSDKLVSVLEILVEFEDPTNQTPTISLTGRIASVCDLNAKYFIDLLICLVKIKLDDLLDKCKTELALTNLYWNKKQTKKVISYVKHLTTYCD